LMHDAGCDELRMAMAMATFDYFTYKISISFLSYFLFIPIFVLLPLC
jgi:hypothetical protein